MLLPKNVFRPGKVPINPGNIYAARGQAETDFEKTLDRGLIPIVYGEYGVGKTTMARHVFNKMHGGLLVNIESVAGKTLADVFSRCLERIGYTVDVEFSRGTQTSKAVTRSGEAGASIPWLSAKLSSSTTGTDTANSSVKSELLVTAPTDSRFIELCEERGVNLILDEMHKASDEFVTELSQFIKAYGNANCDKFKIAVLGTSSDPSRLVARDQGVDRLVEEVFLGSMGQEERTFLVDNGMRSLAINISDEVLTRLCDICVGSPNILQWLCLESAEAGFARSPRIVVMDDVVSAINSYVEKKQSRLYRSYMTAIELTGEVRFRKQILRAMAEVESEYVTMDEIRERVSVYANRAVNSTDISGPLRMLKTQAMGPVLKDVGKNDGNRIQNLTTFVDPALKAYIRLLVARESFQPDASNE